jgi:hypothetical protein
VTNGLGGYRRGRYWVRLRDATTACSCPTWRLQAPVSFRDSIEAIVDGETYFLSGVEFEDGRLQSDLQVPHEFSRSAKRPFGV